MTRTVSIVLLSLLVVLAACRSEGPKNGPVRQDAVKIEVVQTGFYRITPDLLAEAGVALEPLTADSVQLFQGETAVPFYIDDGDLIFYGQAPQNRYTAVRTYLLQRGDAGVTMGETAVSNTAATTLTQLPITLHLEENRLYEAAALPTLPPAERDTSLVDLWFWETLDLRLKKFTIPLDLPQVADGSAHLTLRLWGQSENAEMSEDHDLDVVLNGQTLGTVRWDGRQLVEAEVVVPAGTLREGDNTLVLDNEVPGASFLDIMLLDWLEVTYLAEPVAVADRLAFAGVTGQVSLGGFAERPLLFDTTDAHNPTLLTGWTFADGVAQVAVEEAMQVTAVGPQGYLIPVQVAPVRASDWRSHEQQADLLIITTDELAPALAPLVAARQAAGMAVAVVPVAEIYDAFGQGQAEPASIKAFVRYTRENWQSPAPRYLFLVGEATSDYRNYLGEAPANLVPSPMVPVQFSGETVSDSRLADVDDDGQPDLAVGRWPVSEVAQVESLVARTLAYEGGTAVDRAIFATDASEGQFADIARRLTDATQLTSSAILNGPQASEVAAEFNEGAWLTTYIGHGSVGQWGKDDVFTLAAVKDLDNATPPIVLQLTCLTGLFAHPQNSSLSEQMLWHEGGPLLIVAATSLTLSSHQEPFATSLLQNLQDPAVLHVGDAFQAAKLSLDIGNDGLREISDTFVLLGDPSAKIVRPH